MSFIEVMDQWKTFDIEGYCESVTTGRIGRILGSAAVSPLDFLALLSNAADGCVEQMAQRASRLTRNQFGNAIVLFTPMYISNYCENVCPYCSFACHNDISRSHLELFEIEAEAIRIAATGMRNVLLLTGESPSKVTIEYLEKSVRILRNHFSSVAIEIYPLSVNDYDRLIAAGADMLTLYQETYNQPRYAKLHSRGPKSDYRFRIDAPERGCMAGMHAVTVGALHGLYNWRYDAFFTALHAAYLQRKYPSVELSVSFPRLRPQAGNFTSPGLLSDRQFVRMMTAFRIFMPSAGITLSTRESAQFRMSILPLGITRISAGVSVSVGGHGGNGSTPQFEIADERNAPEMCSDLLAAGFQPVMHDWNRALTG